jgi:hypothetical protein
VCIISIIVSIIVIHDTYLQYGGLLPLAHHHRLVALLLSPLCVCVCVYVCVWVYVCVYVGVWAYVCVCVYSHKRQGVDYGIGDKD